MTQEEFDTRVAVFVNKHLCRTDRIASFDISKDPYTSDLKTRERLFENIISSLNGYDLSLGLFTDQELSYMFELGTLAGRSCGKCTDWFPRIRYTTAGPIFTPVNYGLLYNWYAANDVRNIAADGWHLPSLHTGYLDLKNLIYYYQPELIGYDVIPNTAGSVLKEAGFTYWNSPNTGAINTSNFNARGSGSRSQGTGNYDGLKSSAGLWATDYGDYIECYLSTSGVNFDLRHFGSRERKGMAIRLVKNTTTLTHGQTGTYMGNDGKTYRTICIGTQEWLADNLAETKFRNGDSIPEVTDNTAWAALTSAGMCAYNNDWNNV